MLMSGCIWLPSQILSREFVLIDPSSESSSIDHSSIEAEINSSSSALRSISLNSPLQTVKLYNVASFSYDDVTYGTYETASCVASAPEYGRDVYANTPELFLSNKTSCEETIFHVIGK